MSPIPAGEILEAFDSGKALSGDTETTELRYIVTELANEDDVIVLVAYTAPTDLGPMRRMSIEVTPLGNNIWDCVVQYEGAEEPEYTFETGGATTHITQSLATVAKYPLGDPFAEPEPILDPPNFRGAIGVNGDSIDGTDITIPQFNFTEVHKVPAAAVTGAYKLALFHATGKTNNATFKGFAAGEVLFLGASGSKSGRGHWTVTFKFAASPNVTNLAVGETITVASKKGWEYLWVRFRDEEDAAAQTLVKRPTAAYVERVYESADFSTLGIGT